MDVSKNRGTPKWMVYFMENPIKIDDLGGFPPILGLTPILILVVSSKPRPVTLHFFGKARLSSFRPHETSKIGFKASIPPGSTDFGKASDFSCHPNGCIHGPCSGKILKISRNLNETINMKSGKICKYIIIY